MDREIAEALSRYLEERGVRCFIPEGFEWRGAIGEAIINCQLMVAIFSKSFNLSDQVNREIELCSEEKKPILTFRIQDVEFTEIKKKYLSNQIWIDAFLNPNECFEHLYESIAKLMKLISE